MKAYHITPRETAARSILSRGFRDTAGTYMTEGLHKGVWLADRPLYCVLPYDCTTAACLEVTVDGRAIRRYEWVEDGKGYREWLVPAALLNARAEVRHLTFEQTAALSWG